MTNLLRVATALALATLASCCRLDDSCDACESNPLALECQQNCTDDPNSPECGPQSCSTGIVQIAGCACDATSAGTQAEVAVRHHQQHTEVWCWAAVTSAVIDYYSHLMGEDCQLLSAYAYQRFGQIIDCCYYPGACTRTGSTQEIQWMLSAIGNIRSKSLQGALAEPVLRQELANGRPVIAGLTNTFSGHVIVIVGYDQTGYHIQDPYFGEFRGVAYQALLQNPTIGTWSESIFQMSTEARCSTY